MQPNKKTDRGQSESAVNNQAAEENIVPPKPKIEPPLVRPNESFSERITSRTPSNQAAALRFAEQGRKHLREGEYKRALECFEKAMGIGLHRYLPYVYYYLAWTHYNLGNYQHSLDFLEVAESSLTEQSEWMSVIAAVRGGGTGIEQGARSRGHGAGSPRPDVRGQKSDVNGLNGWPAGKSEFSVSSSPSGRRKAEGTKISGLR